MDLKDESDYEGVDRVDTPALMGEPISVMTGVRLDGPVALAPHEAADYYFGLAQYPRFTYFIAFNDAHGQVWYRKLTGVGDERAFRSPRFFPKRRFGKHYRDPGPYAVPSSRWDRFKSHVYWHLRTVLSRSHHETP